jgi:Protein of unknown function (DUF1360)
MEAASATQASSDGEGLVDGYADEHRPLAGYALLTAAFFAASAGALLATRRSGHELPERMRASDVLLAGAATHKISRLLAKDKVTSAIRAPFTEYEEGSGHGEVSEKPRGRGVRYAIGELLVCPYCLGQWVAAGYGVGMVAAPRLTRLVGFVYTAETVGDFLQLAYSAAEEKS